MSFSECLEIFVGLVGFTYLFISAVGFPIAVFQYLGSERVRQIMFNAATERNDEIERLRYELRVKNEVK